MCTCEKNHTNSLLWTVIVVLIVVLGVTAYVAYQLQCKVNHLQTEVDESYVITDSCEYELPTVESIVNYRRLMHENIRRDSVYMNMPEVSLVSILSEFGTTLDANDIVDIYEADLAKYRLMEKGVKIQNNIDTNKNIIKQDSLLINK